MPILEAPTPPGPSSIRRSPRKSSTSPVKTPSNRFNGFATSNSMQSIASSSTMAHEMNGHHSDEEEYELERIQTDQEEEDAMSEASEEDEPYPDVHVEVRLHPDSRVQDSNIEYKVKDHIIEYVAVLNLGEYLNGWEIDPDLLAHVQQIWVEEAAVRSINPKQANFQIYVYRPQRHEFIEDFNNELEDYDDEDTVTAGSMRTLPSIELDGLWQTLIYADNLKSRLLNFCYSTTFFSECLVDSNIIAWNRVILLHGPPGTGKTSLCRALAQKIAVRMRESYPRAKLIEINSHSLFSKWFSESGKLVQKLFDTITKEVEDDGQFVVVMIDEVESLTAARAAAMTGNEPSDSMRVVNALLTQLDRLRVRKNVLVMTTSNLIDAIDEAFLSRVDLSELVPLPPPEAVYSILKGCIEEMMRKKMIKERKLLEYQRASVLTGFWEGQTNKISRYSGGLAALAKKCHELQISGRTLRKLPVLAHTTKLSGNRKRTLNDWIKAMLDIVQQQFQPPVKTSLVIANETSNGNGVVKNYHSNGHSHSRTKSVDRSQVGSMVAMEGGKDIRDE
ncbi:hypothetical protein I302_103820 [Kwoniella bestiolae CBS 10118]|uniref:AAA+ ATPase domain-containing protein n=1 Tax=Kwoniella bestiolae CBS 10118 TaxID=1296100 RepID=A0AAJ8M7L2_9TREE